MRVGIDLDNTLISYDRLFLDEAKARGLVAAGFAGTKRDVRDAIRLLPDGETEWQRLQAFVYGPGIGGALAAEGALEFVRALRASGAETAIVSHKSVYSNLGESRVNLRDAARGWLAQSGFLGPGAVPEANLYFESTRDEKIARIIALGCTHFIDDLEEVFDDPSFPATVVRMHYASHVDAARPYRTYRSFREIHEALLPSEA